MAISLEQQIKSVIREIGFRKRVYPRWVEQKKMKQEMADLEIATMEAVLATLKHSGQREAERIERVEAPTPSKDGVPW